MNANPQTVIPEAPCVPFYVIAMTLLQVHMTALLIANGGRLWRYRLEFLSERAYTTVFLFRSDTLSDAGAIYRSSISDHLYRRSRFKQSNPLSGYQGEGIGVLRIHFLFITHQGCMMS